MSDDATSAPISPFAAGGAATGGEAPPFAPVWGNIADLPGFSPLPHITMQTITGERMMVNVVRIGPGGVVPTHHHPHEQAGTVLEGVIHLTVGDDTRSLRFGDVYVIPPHVPHSATTDESGCMVLDVFSPPREDYLRALAEGGRREPEGGSR